jgi:hypothetical protein
VLCGAWQPGSRRPALLLLLLLLLLQHQHAVQNHQKQEKQQQQQGQRCFWPLMKSTSLPGWCTAAEALGVVGCQLCITHGRAG